MFGPLDQVLDGDETRHLFMFPLVLIDVLDRFGDGLLGSLKVWIVWVFGGCSSQEFVEEEGILADSLHGFDEEGVDVEHAALWLT